MKKLILVFIAFQLSANLSIAQMYVTASTGGTGWKRIAIIEGQNGRGFGRVSLYTRGGGNYSPVVTNIDWFHDWSGSGSLSVQSDSKQSPHWSAVRMTDDGTNSYIEVNFSKDIPSSSLSLLSDNYGWRPATLYSGTLPNGGGTVRASAGIGRVNIANQFVVAFDGRVGIGTDSPEAKLAVNGNILATEVKVKTDISAPDYVFEPEYKLQTLAEIEAYVKAHKHLPEIPSASDIERDGLDLAEMNLLLLKKVEELTLHLIEKERKEQIQNERIEKLEQQISKP